VNAQLPDLNGVVVPGTDVMSGGGDGRTDTDTEDGGHGTGMATLIAGQGGRSQFAGVAPEAKIMPIVSRGVRLIETAKAIRYAVDHGAKVINLSQSAPAPSGQCLPQLQQAVGYAIQRDVVVVAAAGNDGNEVNSPQDPANCAGVLAVGAVDNQKRAWSDTQRQPYVSVAAPGVSVGAVLKDGQFDGRLNGTSQATALTSGAVALVRSKFPQMPAREVVQRIINTAVDAGPPGKDNMTGSGVILPDRALTVNVPKSAPNPVFEKFDQWQATQPKTQQNPTGQPQGSQSPEDSGSNGTLYVFAVFGGITVLVLGGALLLARRLGRRGGGAPPQQPGPYGSQPGMPPSFGTPPGQRGPQGPPPGGQYSPQGPPPGGQQRPQGPPPVDQQFTPPSGARPQFIPPSDQGGRGPSDEGPPPGRR
jgi:hypothetical protein